MNGIFVTGGTGLVGSHLLFHLTKDESTVVKALHRKNSDLDLIRSIFNYFDPKQGPTQFDRIQWIEGDINDVVSLESGMQDCDRVYHCAALVSFQKKDRNALRKINVEGTANVVNVALDMGIQKLAYVSSIAAIGKKENALSNEDTVWKKEKHTSAYSVSKYDAEREVWRGAEEGLQVIMVNPGVILGAHDWNKGSDVIFKNVYEGLSYYTTGTTAFVDADDVAKALLVLMHSNRMNERFILAAENLSFQEIFTRIANTLQKRPPYKSASPFLLGVAWRAEWWLTKFKDRDPRITRETAQAAFSKFQYDGNRICKELNFAYTPLDDTLQNAWNFFRSNYLR